MSLQPPMATVPRQQPAEIREQKQAPDLKNRAVEEVNKTLEDRGVSTVASPENPGVDATQMSAEIVDEINNSQKTNSSQDIDSLIQGLQGLVQPRVDQHLDQGRNGAQAVDPVGGAGGANKAQDAAQEQKQKKAYWTPDTENGMIHQGQDKIGRVDIKEEAVKPSEKGAEGQAAQNATKKPQAPRQVASAGGAGASKGAGGGTGGATGTGATGAAGAAGAPRQAQGAGQPKPAGQANQANDDKETDKTELSDESKQAAQALQAQGVQQPAALQNAANGGKGDEGGSGSYDVTTRATGMSQSVDVQGAHQLSPGSYLRTFSKLDDSPLLASAQMHRRKGGDVASGIENDQQAQAAAGTQPGQPRQVGPAPEAADPQLLAKLRSPVAS